VNEVCDKCGLPKQLCVCEAIAREEQRIKLKVIKKKFGKLTTIIEGISEKDIDLKELAKKLKGKLACGGTVKEGKIELQGDHREKVKRELIALGFSQDMIEG